MQIKEAASLLCWHAEEYDDGDHKERFSGLDR